MSWAEKAKEQSVGSHDVEKTTKRVMKPRFSVNLNDDDAALVKSYCERVGLSQAALARMLILREIGVAIDNKSNLLK